MYKYTKKYSIKKICFELDHSYHWQICHKKNIVSELQLTSKEKLVIEQKK